MQTPAHNPRRRQRGVGLIEVMVAALILAIGVLGFVGMQLSAMRMSGESHARVQAMAIAQDLIERISMNAETATQASYAVSLSSGNSLTAPDSLPTTCQGQTACSTTDMVAFDLAQAAYHAARLLPDGLVAGRMAASGSNNLQIFVSWGGTQPTVGNASNACMSRNAADVLTYNADANCVMLEATFQ